MSLSKLIQKVQNEFNKYIRNRDKDKTCISCSCAVSEAGHYYSAGHHTALRFNEVNTNGQCTRCNCFLHGNLIHYRNGLIKRYGQQAVDLLDSAATRHPVHKWSRTELNILYVIYKTKNEGQKRMVRIPKNDLQYFQKRFKLKLK